MNLTFPVIIISYRSHQNFFESSGPSSPSEFSHSIEGDSKVAQCYDYERLIDYIARLNLELCFEESKNWAQYNDRTNYYCHTIITPEGVTQKVSLLGSPNEYLSDYAGRIYLYDQSGLTERPIVIETDVNNAIEKIYQSELARLSSVHGTS